MSPLEAWHADLGTGTAEREVALLELGVRGAYLLPEDWAIPERCRAAGYR